MLMVTTGDLERLALTAGLATPSILVRRLSPDSWAAGLAADRPLYPASMIKVPLAAALWGTQDRDPAARVTVNAANMTANDAASPLVPGYAATLDELATLMLTRSDNVATNVLIDVVGRAEATAFCAYLGLAQTAIRRKLSGDLPLIDDPQATGRNAHPAADAARLFEAIATGSAPRSHWLYATLGRQEWNEKLSRGLRPGDLFAHKTADTEEVTHDGGILESAEGHRYVVVVYTALRSSPESDARLAEFMTALRPLL
jgi:beta-lactamase class A